MGVGIVNISIEGGPREPTVNYNHVDGPYLSWGIGQIRWLSWRERLMYWLGVWSAEDLTRRDHFGTRFVQPKEPGHE